MRHSDFEASDRLLTVRRTWDDPPLQTVRAGGGEGPRSSTPPGEELDLLAGATMRSQQALRAAADQPSRPRVGIRPPVAAAAAFLVLAFGALAAWWAVPHADAVVVSLEQTTPPAPSAGDGVSQPTTADGARDEGEVVVHVVGEVLNPGVVHLSAGSRVADALAAAGGAAGPADLAAVNLARVLTDGEQLVVPAMGQNPDEETQPPGDGRVDVNTAAASALEDLPGIGPVLAGRIVTWREGHGPFTAVEELAEVPGIGPAVLAGLVDLVRV